MFKRREFIKVTAASVAGLSLGLAQACTTKHNGIPYRILGKTGLKVSLLTVGGYHIGQEDKLTEKESITLMRTAIDEGINFFDNAWHYHAGRSEERMGKALQDGYRDKVILMTKHHGRDPKTAKEHLETSLKRLKTDVIDLWQFHELMSIQEVDEVYTSGVLDFVLKAREQGKIKHIGFTGHYRPEVHLEMIKRGFEWETIQMPINVLDHHYLSFTQNVLPVAIEKNLGIIGMKSLTGRSSRILDEGFAEIRECMKFAMSMPVSTLCSGMDSMEILKENIQITRDFKPMLEEEIAELLGRSFDFSANGKLEPYKT